MALKIKPVAKPASKTTTEAVVEAVAKKKAKKAIAEQLTETQALVNEMVHLDQHMKQLEVAEMVARFEAIKKRLQSIANEDYSPDKEAVLEGTEGKVIFSPRRTTTTVADRDEMIEKLTPEVFLNIANVTITDLRKYLAEGELTFLEQSYGARTLKTLVEN